MNAEASSVPVAPSSVAPDADLQAMTRSLLQTTAAYTDAVKQIERTLARNTDPAERREAVALALSTLGAWLETAREQDREFTVTLAEQRSTIKELLTVAQQRRDAVAIRHYRIMIDAIDKATRISGKPVRVLQDAASRIKGLG